MMTTEDKAGGTLPGRPGGTPAAARAAIGVLLAGLCAALVLAFGLARGAAALEIEFSGRKVKRDILAVYDSRHEQQPSQTRLHRFTEMPLNWLGFRLTYLDVNAALPPPAEAARYRGILSWLIEPMQQPEAYLDWLDKVTAEGVRFVHIGEIAPPEPAHMMGVMNRILARIGLAKSGEFVSVTHKARIVHSDPQMIGFERPLDKKIPEYPVLTPIDPSTAVHLAAESPLRDATITSALVVTGRGGGYASDNAAVFFDPNTDKVRWVLNPFRFFRAAFGEERFPIPDVTTLTGQRIYFSHIDGDGWNNLTEIEAYRGQGVTSVEVIARHAIEAYPDLPVTVGLIAGDIDARLGGNPEAARHAQRLFALPQVEVASHTYTHPFDWQFYERYDEAAEAEKIRGIERPDRTPAQRVRLMLQDLAGKTRPKDRFARYIAGGAELPRVYLKEPFDLAREVQGALAASEALAPAGKKARLYLWSGDTRPFEAAIRATREAGVRNMNGGDSRLDAEYPSVFYVPPIARSIGSERQIYAASSNENTYTNDWTGPYHGFFMLEHTLRNTEQPRRLKPFNLYYHMYIGEKAAALASLRKFLDLARSSEVTPVEASHYAAIADDFFGVEIEQVDLFSWAIGSRGALQTVRFDAAGDVAIDYQRSLGVLGARQHGESLYVALDPAQERAVVTLRPIDALGEAGAARGRTPLGREPVATLVRSRWRMSGLVESQCGLEVTATGFGPGEFVWSTRPGRAFRFTASRRGAVLAEEVRWASAAGLLSVATAVSALEPLTLRLDCHE
jgi:hypothetical protein